MTTGQDARGRTVGLAAKAGDILEVECLGCGFD